MTLNVDSTDGISEALDGQPSEGTANEGNQPTNDANALPAGEPTGEGSAETTPPVKDAAFWENQYKEIQSLSDKRYNEMQTLQESMKGFEAFGGPQQVLQLAQQLSSDPSFAEWVKGRDENKYGIDMSNVDEAQKEAISLVEKIAEDIAERKVADIRKNEVDPLVEKNLRSHVEGVFTQMDKKHAGWRDIHPEMKKLVGKLSPEVAKNPSFQDIEGLYMMALVNSGKMEEFAAAQYKQKLEEKQRNSSDTPPTSQGSANEITSKTLTEALANAKKKHGISGSIRFS